MPPAGVPLVPGRPKLRDSCNACAVSKVKCSREKPTCSRCMRRGSNCEYLVTRRAGRRTDKARLRSSTISSSSSQRLIPFVPQVPILDTAIQMLDEPNYGLPTDAANSTVDFDLFLGSPCSILLTDSADELPVSYDPGALNSAESTNLEAPCPSTIQPASGMNDSFPLTSPIIESSSQTTSLSGLSCGCPFDALDSLRQLMPPCSSSCVGMQISSYTGQGLTAVSILATNGPIIETMIRNLRCFCVNDGLYLVFVLTAALKALGWYAAAVRALNPLWTRINLGGTALNDDPVHLTAQSVFSELHRIQDLVKALHPKIEQFEADCEGDKPFSPAVVLQLALDLRKQIRELSMEIVDLLRS
ncbi:Aflatoxin biosynthesis regulatory protein [Penicillium herquei]|nr:Aflatoxin biosynthesis regulatory protein [Penicillium herquei]